VRSAAGNTHIGIRTDWNGSSYDTTMFVVDSLGTTLQSSADNPLNLDFTSTLVRLRLESGSVHMESWSGSSWTSHDSVAIANVDSDLQLWISSGDTALDTAGTLVYDNVYVTNDNYSSSIPT
jgi:hypothetical protein